MSATKRYLDQLNESIMSDYAKATFYQKPILKIKCIKCNRYALIPSGDIVECTNCGAKFTLKEE